MKSFRSNDATLLCDVGPAGDSVTSVGFTQRGTILAVGTSAGDVHLWDVARMKRVRSMGGHRSRVGALASSARLLSSGGGDGRILHRDPRAPEDFVSSLRGHMGDVCGLKWSPNERDLASGGSDGKLLVWNVSGTSGAPSLRFLDHTAAVKAIAWSPHQSGVLASGGGTLDQCIRFWNTNNGTPISRFNTGSMVSNLAWSRNTNEIVSTHGYPHNSVAVWRYSSMLKLVNLGGAISYCFRLLGFVISAQQRTRWRKLTHDRSAMRRSGEGFRGPAGAGSSNCNPSNPCRS